jgi:hypothetical protein
MNRVIQLFHSRSLPSSFPFLDYFPYFEKNKGRLWDHFAVCALPPNVAKQQLGTHLSMAMNTHAQLEELFDAVPFVQSASSQMVTT